MATPRCESIRHRSAALNKDERYDALASIHCALSQREMAINYQQKGLDIAHAHNALGDYKVKQQLCHDRLVLCSLRSGQSRTTPQRPDHKSTIHRYHDDDVCILRAR